MKRISGDTIANKLKEQIKKEISLLHREIIFSIIYVGQDPIIDNFIRYKKRFGEDVGVIVLVHNFKEDVDEGVLISRIEEISEDSDALIIQLPLPKHLNLYKVLDSVPAEKDIDVLSNGAKELFIQGKNRMFPPVTGAMIEILKSIDFVLENKNIVVVGYGNLVGKPFGSWLSKQELKYDIIDRQTSESEKKDLLENADLIVSGAGIPGLIQSNMIKEGVVLLDAGTSEEGKRVIGDIDPACYEKALFYTPVPGGIGPVTIAVLYQNILKAIKSISF